MLDKKRRKGGRMEERKLNRIRELSRKAGK